MFPGRIKKSKTTFKNLNVLLPTQLRQLSKVIFANGFQKAKLEYDVFLQNFMRRIHTKIYHGKHTIPI